jgi:hypothetical protein
MAELMGDEDGVMPLGDEDAREGVPEDVECDALDTGSFGRFL